jgi:hypothetical protein
VEIILEGETEGKMNLAPTGVQTPSDPAVRFSVADNRFELRWRILKDASRFHVLRDGKTVEETTNSHFGAPLPREFSVYNIRSIAGNGLPSNPTKPLFIHPDSVYLEVQAETAVPAERLAAQHSGFSGKGYVMHDAKPEDVLRFPVTVEKPGRYLVRLRYANGNGPINTENKCATRYLTIGKRELGVLVMPQRGSWTSWGHSNGIQLELAAGKQEIAIGWDSGLANMNGRTDNAAIDRLELIRLP